MTPSGVRGGSLLIHLCNKAHLIEQVESGFSLGDNRPEYADDGQYLAVPLARLTHHLDPNAPGGVATLTSGRWRLLMPG